MDRSEFEQRRKHVLDQIDDGVLLLPAAPVAIRNNDVEHEYRQDSDLHYLTGYDEPDSVLALSSDGASPFVLFVRERNPERETWDGPRAGTEGAVDRFGADEAHPIDDLATKLPDLLENRRRLYYRLGRDRAFDERVLAALDVTRTRARRGSTHPTEIVDPAVVLHEMRLHKSAAEVAVMERSADITAHAHAEAMRAAAPGMHEYEVEAILRAEFRKRGAQRPAYAPIVGSGPNATILHYHDNDRLMQDGDLLLIDAGSELDYYAADVTRTFPVSGRFGVEQREIYEAVLDAQLASIAECQVGRTLEDAHQASVRRLCDALVRLGIVQGPTEEAIEEGRYKPYYMHKTSHYLGMDVHDVGTYYVDRKHRPLAEGFVVTVEPGLYFAVDDESVPERYRGIGVRIEDDVLIVADGPRVLTDAIPKSVDDVERACRG
jgi:Xaa-Pro aminopeptidase